MPKVDDLNGVLGVLLELKNMSEKKDNVSVVVGYTQSYAIFVHENLESHHTVGNAKYLESPANRLKATMGKIVSTVYAATGDMEKGLIAAGLRLQRESQLEVPIDTGALRASAFTAASRNVETASKAAFTKSQAIRNRKGK